MTQSAIKQSLEKIGIVNLERIYWNTPTPALYERVVRRREGYLSHMGPLVVRTGYYTGRAAKDKFIVEEPSSQGKVWWGEINQCFPEASFDALCKRVFSYLETQQVFVQDCFAGADPAHEVPVRVITQDAWHALFARTMLIRPVDVGREIGVDDPQFTVVHVPHFHAIPSKQHTNSEAFVILHLGKRLALIGGTSYAGEIKKMIFTWMNYILPQQDILSMHASANVGKDGASAVFFGLSGTGKTTLSADPERRLIGDDEHGWSDEGIFNIEGGCYAKVIQLSAEKEPEIYSMTRKFGTIMENVRFDIESRRVDLDDDCLTENTRAAYPIPNLPNAIYPGVAGHPKNIVMLTADAFGVLPPVAKLTPEQAKYYFLLGYTAKVAGTEAGITEPEAVFSPCFGAPFMPMHPDVYARLLGEKIAKHHVNCWLINTGWSGGPYGVGERMDITDTRAMLNAALSGQLDDVAYREHSIFRLQMPETCPGVDARVLDPVCAWGDARAYEEKARELAGLFHKAFDEIAGDIEPELAAAGPA
jgi:phosphoenolpyruvate carboxykinase (ATP)